MANDGLFFRKLAEVHPRCGTPALAIIAGSAWSIVLALAGNFTELFTYVVFCGWIFYGLSAATVFVYRKRIKDEAYAYKTPGYPWTPLLFIAAAFVLVINTLVDNIKQAPYKTAFAVSIILLGIPAYLLWRWHSSVASDSPVSPEAS